MKRLIILPLAISALMMVLLACGAEPTPPPTLDPLPRIMPEDITDWDQAMKLITVLRDRNALLIPMVEACEYEPIDAYPYLPCCWQNLAPALRETKISYDSYLEEARLIEMIFGELHGEPMTDAQKDEFETHWTFAIMGLQQLTYPTERMLRDFGCLDPAIEPEATETPPAIDPERMERGEYISYLAENVCTSGRLDQDSIDWHQLRGGLTWAISEFHGLDPPEGLEKFHYSLEFYYKSQLAYAKRQDPEASVDASELSAQEDVQNQKQTLQEASEALSDSDRQILGQAGCDL